MNEVFLQEILSQPGVLRAVLARYLDDAGLLQSLARLWPGKAYDLVLLTGMGTSYFSLYPACIYLNAHGVPAMMLETSELLHYYPRLISERVLLLVVSQSGETIEARNLLDEAGGRTQVVSVTNNPESTVARKSDLPLYLYAGREEGPASKSYTCSLAVLLLCAMALTARRDVPEIQGFYAAADAIAGFLDGWQTHTDRLSGFVGPARYLALLGRGPSMASAAAGSLILKEVAKVQAEAMSGGQFRHGPLEVAAPGFTAVVFAPPGRTRDLNLRLAHDVARFGGKVVLVGAAQAAAADGGSGRMLSLALPPLAELYAPLVEIVPLQLLARQMALDRGLEPGRFDQAGKVTLEE